MKLKFAVLFALIFGYSVTQAQIYLGPRVGVNLANMSTNAAGTENSMKIGISGGASLKWKFAKRVSLLGEALFSQQGTSSLLSVAGADGSIITTTETKATYNFVHVPVMVNLEVPIKSEKRVPYRMGGSFASWNLYAGGFFGYALSASSNVTMTDMSVTPYNIVTSSGAAADGTWNNIDFGAALGTGFTFEMDPRNFLSVDARYVLGFADADKSATVKSTHNFIGVSLAYHYRLTRRNIRR